jgi:phage protein GP46|nr:MAG TPA: hypothetical protein [Caudoviricetes sp.]
MDILLQDKGDGAEVVLAGGDLKGDGTLYNAVYLSLFSGDNFSNAYEEYESDNEFEESLNLPITTPNLKTVKAAANKSLKWMIDEGIADSVDCFAYGGQSGKIEVEIKIQETAGDNQSFALIWENQKKVLKAL